MISAAQLVAMVVGERMANPAEVISAYGEPTSSSRGEKEFWMHRSLLLIVTLLALLAAPVAAQEATPGATPQVGALSPVASGLVNPRGFLWTADGTLYVAQAGAGGVSLGTPAVPEPFGPWRGGTSGSVVRIEDGCPVLVAENLPSVVGGMGDVLGVEDLAVLGGQL